MTATFARCMPTYRLFLYNAQNHIVDHAVIEVADDQAAFDYANQILSYRDIEIWQGPRIIARLPRSRDRSHSKRT